VDSEAGNPDAIHLVLKGTGDMAKNQKRFPLTARIVGAGLVSIPFVSLAIMMIVADGWATMLLVFGGVFAYLACIVGGAYLLSGSLPKS